MPEVMAPEAHQNNCSYVRGLSWPTFDSLHKNLGGQLCGGPQKIDKIGGWALAQDNTVGKGCEGEGKEYHRKQSLDGLALY